MPMQMSCIPPTKSTSVTTVGLPTGKSTPANLHVMYDRPVTNASAAAAKPMTVLRFSNAVENATRPLNPIRKEPVNRL